MQRPRSTPRAPTVSDPLLGLAARLSPRESPAGGILGVVLLAALPWLAACGSDGTGPDPSENDDEPPAASPVRIETSRLPPALEDRPYDVALEATGGDGTDYAWSVEAGALPPGLDLTPDGHLRGTPSEAGSAAFSVTATSGGRSDTEALTLGVRPHDPSRFDITVIQLTGAPTAVLNHLDAAVARWERVITGDLPSGTFQSDFFGSGDCGGNGDLLNGTSVDDIGVLVLIDSIDGGGQVIGRAGPCATRGEDGPPVAGSLTLDVVDLEPLVGDEALTALIFHEIGHVLGFGVVWDDLIEDAGGEDPRFTGSEAVEAFQDLGGGGNVPVENQGGGGTAESHWRESVFGAEVMTGFAEPAGTAQPLSTVTIASMVDIGYEVDFSEADPFSLSSASAEAVASSSGPLPGVADGYEVVLREGIRALPDGPIEPRRRTEEP